MKTNKLNAQIVRIELVDKLLTVPDNELKPLHKQLKDKRQEYITTFKKLEYVTYLSHDEINQVRRELDRLEKECLLLRELIETQENVKVHYKVKRLRKFGAIRKLWNNKLKTS